MPNLNPVYGYVEPNEQAQLSDRSNPNQTVTLFGMQKMQYCNVPTMV